MVMRSWQLAAGGSVLTALLLAALFPPFGVSALAPVALAPMLYWIAQEPFGERRLLWGWVGGMVYWAVSCNWVGDVLAAYGGLNGPLSVVALGLFAAFKGLHMAVFAWLAGFVMRRRWAIPAVAALWVGVERLHGPAGFPWLLLGNAGIEMGVPLRIAPFLGVYGVSFVFAAVGCGVALVALRRERKELVWLGALPLLLLLPPAALKRVPAESAVAVQTNVAADFAWTGESTAREVKQLAMATLAEALDVKKQKPSLLLWPEAPAPFYYYDDAGFRAQVTEVARLAGAPFLFGSVAYTAAREPLNAAVLVGAGGSLMGRYDKVRLVPFGEFVPPGFGWIEKISSEAGSYAAGAEAKVLYDGEHALGAFICYESAFPEYVRRFSRAGAEVLVSVTNDGYFGRSAGPRGQHLLLARMRAVENGRWVLRPSNDGVTGSIDPGGRVWDEMPERVRVAGRLRFNYETERTFYARHGDWFAWLALAAGLAAVIWTQVPSYKPAR